MQNREVGTGGDEELNLRYVESRGAKRHPVSTVMQALSSTEEKLRREYQGGDGSGWMRP